MPDPTLPESQPACSGDSPAEMSAGPPDSAPTAVAVADKEPLAGDPEERYRGLFELMAQGVVYRAADGYIIAANPAARRILGVTHEQMEGRTSIAPVLRRIHPDGSDFPEDTCPSMIAIRTGRPVWGVQMGVFNPQEGDYRWIAIDAVPQFRPGEQTAYQVFTTFQDITEQVRAQQRLEQSEAKNRAFIDAIPDLMFLVDSSGALVDFRAQKECELLVPREDLIGRRLTDVLPEEVALEALARMEAVAATGAVEAFEYRTAEGDRDRWFEARVAHAGGGRAMLLVRDATERRRAEDTRARLAAIVDSSDDAVIGLDAAGMVTSWNQGATQMYGYRAADMIGRSLGPILPPGASGAELQIFGLVAQGKVVRQESVHLGRNGARIDVSLAVSPVRDPAGKVTGMAIIVHDISAPKRVEKELKDSRDQLRRLAARSEQVREQERTRIAREIHDELGQILTVLKMQAGGIVAKLGSSASDPADLCARLDAMVEHIDSSIQSVKRISAELRPGVLDHLGLIAAIEWQAADFERRTGIRCQIRSLPDEQPLDPDRRTAVFRIFQEILTNVARHAHADVVEITVSAPPGELRLEVRDNGIGIERSHLEDPKSLGLLGMRERSDLAGARLSFKGQRGKGTLVSLVLPLASKTAAAAAVNAENSSRRDRLRILIAEDHTMFRRCEREILAAAFPDAVFEEAASGDEAVAKACRDQWDVIVLDLTMPGRSGIGVLRSLRRSGVKTPAIILSMHPESDFGERARKAGSSGYVDKDRASEELVAAVRTVLGGGTYFREAPAPQIR